MEIYTNSNNQVFIGKMALLTDQILASGVTLNDLFHIVITGDTSQNPAGSSYKATVQQFAQAIGSIGFSGGTVIYPTNFTGGLSANTFSATTYLNLPRLPYLPLSGGTVTGNTYFGTTSGITIDQVNNRLGINTANPQYTIDAFGTKSNVSYQDTSGGVFQISGGTLLPRFSVVGSPSVTRPLFSLSMGVRTYDDVTFPGYGKVGDGHLYGSNEMNGLNIINRQGSGTTEDYIRFYAGQDANGTIPDIHIQGSGSTRGYVGIGTTNPTELLDVSGNTRIRGGLTASTLNISSAPTTDTNSNPTYLTRDSSTGNVKIIQTPGTTVYGLFSQTGNSVVVSATTTETSIIGGGVGNLIVPPNGFNVGDSFRVTISGVLNCANGQTIRIRVKSGSVSLADSGTQSLVNNITGDIWSMSLDFTIRQIGGTGVASIITLGQFHYTKTSNGTVEGFSFNSLNNTTFNTTTSNTLDMTVQWGSNNAGNSIYSDIFVLNKVF